MCKHDGFTNAGDCDRTHRALQGAETTQSEQRPPTTPHITRDDYSERAPLTDGHGEPVDEQRRRLPDTAPLDDLADALAELRFRLTPRGYNALTNGDA